MMTGRQIKKKIRALLTQDDAAAALEAVRRLPARQAVNPLFSFFHSPEERLRWRAISAMGAVVCGLARVDMEAARVVMRRHLWNLNDESGGIGWGSPESMGEIMARSAPLAGEYAHMLSSYIRPGGNFLEHETLQRGVLWGLGRLAHARPRLLEESAPFFKPFLKSHDPLHRGLAAWAVGALAAHPHQALLSALTGDGSRIRIYMDMALVERTVGGMAREALKGLPIL